MPERKGVAPRCPMCGAPMSRTYVRPVVEGRQAYVPVGWCCAVCRMMSWD